MEYTKSTHNLSIKFIDDLKPYCKEMLTKSKVLFPVPKVDDFVGLKTTSLFFFLFFFFNKLQASLASVKLKSRNNVCQILWSSTILGKVKRKTNTHACNNHNYTRKGYRQQQ